MEYPAVYVMSGATWPWGGSEGHRKARVRRQNFTVDDDGRGVHLRPGFEVMEERWSPRHRHTFEQIRFQVSGEQYYGSRKWTAGTIAYLPESVPYGPHRTAEGPCEEIALQFPSPTGRPFFSGPLLVQAMQALVAQGVRFENGLAVHPTGRKQDSTEACWEHLCEGRVPYAPARYADPVVMQADHFPWADSAVPGVAVKRLAYFNAYGPNLMLLRLAPGASTPPGRLDCTQVRFVVDGAVAYDGESCPRVSCLYYPPGAAYSGLDSEAGGTVLVVQMQSPQGAVPPLEGVF